jgi:hypothetical protein
MSKDLKSLVVPLSTGVDIPAPAPLQAFWRGVFDALEQVDPMCDLSTLKGIHIHKLAPILLGQTAWSLLSPDDIQSWGDFVKEVETQFGVNSF